MVCTVHAWQHDLGYAKNEISLNKASDMMTIEMRKKANVPSLYNCCPASGRSSGRRPPLGLSCLPSFSSSYSNIFYRYRSSNRGV